MLKKSQVMISAFLYSFLSVNTVIAADKAEALSTCEQAEETRQSAAQAKMEWTTTAGLIKKGNEAIQQGDFDKAIKLCELAQFQGEASIKQAETEANTWKARLPN